MISHEYKFITVNNMKCASVSMCESLSPYSKPDYGHFSAYELKTGIMESPASKRFYNDTKDILLEKRKNWDDYSTIAIIRDPYSHFLSTYLYLKKYKENITFKEYSQIQNDTNYSWLSDWNFTCLYDRISDKDDNIIVDYILRMETLYSDWDSLCEKLSLPKISLRKSNRSHYNNHLDGYYTNTEKEIVKKLYKKDFDYLYGDI